MGEVNKNRTKNIFDFLEEITNKKSPVESFTEEDWDKNFNSYMIHRFISFNPYYIEIANAAQILPPQNKKQIYSFYKEFIPKRKTWFKYIKPLKSDISEDLVSLISTYFECSKQEAREYIPILGSEQIVCILTLMGVDEKEIKKYGKKSTRGRKKN